MVTSSILSCTAKVLAKLAKLPISQRLRKHSIVQQLKQVPLSCASLGLEIPEHPALSLHLEGIQLRLDILANLAFPRIAPILDLAAEVGITAPTRSHPPAARKRSLVTVASFETVEMRRAVGHCA